MLRMPPNATTTKLYSTGAYIITTRNSNTAQTRKHARRRSSGLCATSLALTDKENMPPDTPKPNANNASNNNGRPLMPILASTRTVKSPLTPRLAAQYGNANATATPASRRSLRSDISAIKSPTSAREDLSTPVKAFINTNITPRSSSRKSRVDSPQSTPSVSNASTPATNPKFVTASGNAIGDGFYSTENASQPTFNTAAMNGATAPRRPVSMLAGGGGLQTYSLARPALTGRATSPARGAAPMFFHASDAKAVETPAPARPPLKKGPSFFYADGRQDETAETDAGLSPTANLPSPPLSSIGASSSQFFHADGSARRLTRSPPLASPPLPASISEMQMPSSTVNHMPNLRPGSPSKESIHLSYRKGASQIMRPASILPPRQVKDDSIPPRQTSVGSSKRTSHTKGSSLSSIDSASNVSAGKSASRSSSLNVSQTQPQTVDAQIKQGRRVSGIPTAVPKSIQMPPLNLDVQPSVYTPGSATTPLSPTKGAMSQQMTEMAAQARRERKVMDLEISNSSLLAINRQLEREVRKQKAELRRYRRLTRAGRLSVTAAGGSSAAAAEHDDIIDANSDEDDIDAQSDDDEEEEDLSESDESALSPSALAEHDQKRIAKDEKRLRLDLSKHRQLLVDSQNMNQSLRRCLGWTEELIKEGKRALSYRVRVSDVKLGGRVLRRDDDFEEGLEESHLGDIEEASPEAEHADDEQIEVEEEEAKDMGDIMSLMSPWMRSAPLGTVSEPLLPADSMLDSRGRGIDAPEQAGTLPGPV